MKSFSILSLLLLVALFATGIALYQCRQELTETHNQYLALLETTAHIDIQDSRLFHYRRLPQTAPLVFQYQIAVPSEVVMQLNVVGGKKTNQSTLFQMDLPGPNVEHFLAPSQYLITVYIQNTPKGYRVGCESAGGRAWEHVKTGRLAWIDSMSATTELPDLPDNYKFSVQTSDPKETVELHFQSESSTTLSGKVKNVDNPNVLIISVGPKEDAESAR